MPPRNDKRTTTAWAFYDWANSVYALVITAAIFPAYYEAQTTIETTDGKEIDIVNFFGLEIVNTVLYERAFALSYLVIALTSPLLSGIADYTGSKKRFMQFFVVLGSFACAGLFFFDAQTPEAGIILMFLASVGFAGSLVFYNAFLPEIATPDRHDNLSAKGFALGYAGGLVLLGICLTLIMSSDDAGFYSRISFLLTGLWWFGFSLYPFAVLKDRPKEIPESVNRFTKGYKELRKVWTELDAFPRLKRFLRAFFSYSVGVQTILFVAALFAKKALDLPSETLIIAILLIQLLGIGGAYLFAIIAGRIGNIKTLMILTLFWSLVCVGGMLAQKGVALHFYVLAAGVGAMMGGVQSLSRSTYSKMLPETVDTASYFSFYEVSEKLAIVFGMLAWSIIESITGSMRYSILLLAVFFFIGLILLIILQRYIKKEEREQLQV